MNWISTTIKRKYMDKILEGEKRVEYKKASEFWKKRLQKYIGFFSCRDVGINFLCGQESYKYMVQQVTRHRHLKIEIDGELIEDYYKIYLGQRLKELEAR